MRWYHRLHLRKVLTVSVLGAGIVLLARLGTVDSLSEGGDIAAILAIVIIGIPALLFAVFVFSFMVYHAIKHGNPFLQDDHTKVIVIKENTPKKQRLAHCPICKRNTRCSVKRSAGGFWIHTMRG